SRRRHTRSKRDWSSDVCSSDLDLIQAVLGCADLRGANNRITVGRRHRRGGCLRIGASSVQFALRVAGVGEVVRGALDVPISEGLCCTVQVPRAVALFCLGGGESVLARAAASLAIWGVPTGPTHYWLPCLP